MAGLSMTSGTTCVSSHFEGATSLGPNEGEGEEEKDVIFNESFWEFFINVDTVFDCEFATQLKCILFVYPELFLTV